MEYLFFGFAFAFAYKIVVNVSALFRLNFYRRKYDDFLSNRITDFNEYAPAIRKLFKDAGIKDAWIPFVQPAGYGMLSKGNASFFSNLATTNGQCVELMIRGLSEAKGSFKGRLLEAFSPLYWANCVIYLPRKILEYLGLDTSGITCRILQIIYWLCTPLLVLFRDNIYQYIAELLG